MAKTPNNIGAWIAHTLKKDPPRSKSLIITIFGDSIAPCASGVWLSELIDLLQPFNVNERLVRTSSFRLAEEQWLRSVRDGRRSRYTLTPSGLARVQHAYRRVYQPAPSAWDGNWTVVIPSRTANPSAARVQLRRELEWEGFGTLAAGVFLHPSADLTTLKEILSRLKLTRHATVLRAQHLPGLAPNQSLSLTRECWNLDRVAAHYLAFLKVFDPVPSLLRGTLEPETAFLVQTLLIHSFRRVILHDPRLPAALLPKAWPGHTAYRLCRQIYRLTLRQTGLHLTQRLSRSVAHTTLPNDRFNNHLGGPDA